MDRDDRRRYFVVGSIVLEVVTPLFQHRIENEYTSHGFGSLQAFVNSKPVVHIIFHLRHKNVWCCKDQANCTNNGSLPVNYSQWDMLYTENPGTGNHHCHCKFTAKPIHLDDLDITLASVILLNCCNLGPADKNAIKELRKLKNNYLSHNAKGRINQTEYMSLWTDLTTNILQLDGTKQDELVRSQHRPLDESLCIKYCIKLLDIEEKLEEINVSIQEINTSVQSSNTLLHQMDTSVQSNNTLLDGMNTLLQSSNTLIFRMSTSVQSSNTLLHGMNTSLLGFLQGMKESVQINGAILQELLSNSKQGIQKQHSKADVAHKTYKLGQSIFHLHHQFDLKSVLNGEQIGFVKDGLMMDDGRLVLCVLYKNILLISNTDGSQADSIPLYYKPWSVTAVSNSTVAVISVRSDYIEMYEINDKHKLKSIPIPGMWCNGITTINNKLVVGGPGKLHIIDHQTAEVVQTIRKEEEYDSFFINPCVHTTGDRIFYSYGTKHIYCYSYTDDKHSTTTLPARPLGITSLHDGSLYVICADRSVQHVSSDGKHYKAVTTKGLKSSGECWVISFSQKQRKLVTCTYEGTVKVFNEK